jgi:hypothetical protein
MGARQAKNGHGFAAPAFRLTPASTLCFRIIYAILKHPPSCPCAYNHSPHAGLHQSDAGVRGLKTEREAAGSCTLDNSRASRSGIHSMRYTLGSAYTTGTLRGGVGLSAPIFCGRDRRDATVSRKSISAQSLAPRSG